MLLKSLIIRLPAQPRIYTAAWMAFWVLAASLIIRWIVEHFFYTACPTHTLYGFLEVSCQGFVYADTVGVVLYVATNLAIGACAAILLFGGALIGFAQGQRGMLYTDQQTVWPTVWTVAAGMAAFVFFALALLYVLYVVARWWAWGEKRLSE